MELDDKTKAINLLIDIVADEKTDDDSRKSVIALIGLLADDGNDGTCPNHVGDSWGACENCGMCVY